MPMITKCFDRTGWKQWFSRVFSLMPAPSGGWLAAAALCAAGVVVIAAPSNPEQWRSDHRIIDMHQHVDYSTQHLARAVKIMDTAGIGMAINLDGGVVTKDGTNSVSAFEKNKTLADSLFPGRFVHYMHLDYAGWDSPDWPQQAVKQVDEGYRLGAAGLKEFKRLGLYIKDGKGKLIRADDPKLAPVWERCGELNMPVSIHVADPKAFWAPYDQNNERWKELKDHPKWWFGDTNQFPGWKTLLETMNRVIEQHPKTTFVCVHFANNAEELDWVDAALTKYPNMMADLAARIPEIGRHDPEAVRKLFIKHQDRILFGTDFMVYDRLILGSSGNEPPPTDRDAQVFFDKEWRWLETQDKNWEHMTPIQGDWTISSIGLPDDVLRKVYFDNARKLLARSLPLPKMQASHLLKDFEPDANLNKPEWKNAKPVYIGSTAFKCVAMPEIETTVRALWSEDYFYLAYEGAYTKLTQFDPSDFKQKRAYMDRKGASLWDRDVVEAFIGTDLGDVNTYKEFQVAPTNEKVDLALVFPKRDFEWTSRFTSAVVIDESKHIWRCEVKIPVQSLSKEPLKRGSCWRINVFRCDVAHEAFLSWCPSLNASFHVPSRFGIVEMIE